MLQEKDLADRIHSPVLRSDAEVALPSIELTSAQITAEFEEDLVDRPELIATLRQGVVLQPVPEVPHRTTFSVEGPTKNFWIKLFHSREDTNRIERVHIIGVMHRGSETRRIDLH